MFCFVFSCISKVHREYRSNQTNKFEAGNILIRDLRHVLWPICFYVFYTLYSCDQHRYYKTCQNKINVGRGSERQRQNNTHMFAFHNFYNRTWNWMQIYTYFSYFEVNVYFWYFRSIDKILSRFKNTNLIWKKYIYDLVLSGKLRIHIIIIRFTRI